MLWGEKELTPDLLAEGRLRFCLVGPILLRSKGSGKRRPVSAEYFFVLIEIA